MSPSRSHTDTREEAIRAALEWVNDGNDGTVLEATAALDALLADLQRAEEVAKARTSDLTAAEEFIERTVADLQRSQEKLHLHRGLFVKECMEQSGMTADEAAARLSEFEGQP